MAHRLPHIVLLLALAQSASRAYSPSGREETCSCLKIKQKFISAMFFAMVVHMNLKWITKLKRKSVANLQTHRSQSLYSLYKCQAGNPTVLWPSGAQALWLVLSYHVKDIVDQFSVACSQKRIQSQQTDSAAQLYGLTWPYQRKRCPWWSLWV